MAAGVSVVYLPALLTPVAVCFALTAGFLSLPFGIQPVVALATAAPDWTAQILPVVTQSGNSLILLTALLILGRYCLYGTSTQFLDFRALCGPGRRVNWALPLATPANSPVRRITSMLPGVFSLHTTSRVATSTSAGLSGAVSRLN